MLLPILLKDKLEFILWLKMQSYRLFSKRKEEIEALKGREVFKIHSVTELD